MASKCPISALANEVPALERKQGFAISEIIGNGFDLQYPWLRHESQKRNQRFTMGSTTPTTLPITTSWRRPTEGIPVFLGSRHVRYSTSFEETIRHPIFDADYQSTTESTTSSEETQPKGHLLCPTSRHASHSTSFEVRRDHSPTAILRPLLTTTDSITSFERPRTSGVATSHSTPPEGKTVLTLRIRIPMCLAFLLALS